MGEQGRREAEVGEQGGKKMGEQGGREVEVGVQMCRREGNDRPELQLWCGFNSRGQLI